MHRNTKGESPCVANVKNCVRKTLKCTELRRATRSTLQRVHKCIEVGGGIFENFVMRCARRRRARVLSIADHQ